MTEVIPAGQQDLDEVVLSKHILHQKSCLFCQVVVTNVEQPHFGVVIETRANNFKHLVVHPV